MFFVLLLFCIGGSMVKNSSDFSVWNVRFYRLLLFSLGVVLGLVCGRLGGV